MKRTILLIIIGILLSGCQYGSTPTPTRTEPPTATITLTATEQTPIPTVTATSNPTGTPTLTASATATATQVVLALLEPAARAELPKLGQVRFGWNGLEGAAVYRLVIETPGGGEVAFETSDTNYNLYIETLRWGGSYSWRVQALDGYGNLLAEAGGGAFTKGESPLSGDDSNEDGTEEGGEEDDGGGGSGGDDDGPSVNNGEGGDQ